MRNPEAKFREQPREASLIHYECNPASGPMLSH